MCLRIFQRNIPFYTSIHLPALLSHPSIHSHNPLPTSGVLGCFYINTNAHTCRSLSFLASIQQREKVNTSGPTQAASLVCYELVCWTVGQPMASWIPNLHAEVAHPPCSVTVTPSHLPFPPNTPLHTPACFRVVVIGTNSDIK